jgi:plastocyanin
MQKIEGHVTFHTAMSTAFPQPVPGTAPSPGPMKVADDRLRKVLGLSRMSFRDVHHPIAITDLPLEEELSPAGGRQVAMDNFSFTPPRLAIPMGASVVWTNHDDVPHTVVSTDRSFKSPTLDTDGQFSRRFDAVGTFPYFCSIHPRMTGEIVVG